MLDNWEQSSPAPAYTVGISIEAQVAHAQKMQALMRLVSTVAHDFDNVWASIAGYTDLMLYYIPDDYPIRSDLEQIRKATDAATCLMRKWADFARTKSLGAFDFDLGELLVSQAEQLRQMLGQSNELVLQLTPEPWQVRAHTAQIAQVVTHLATNAREAMSRDGILRLVIENVHLVQPLINRFAIVPQGEYVALTVIDNGPGIPAAIQEHVFEPGVTTKKGQRGAGLGLATCYSIIQQHNGFIWLDSVAGQGTTVSLYLPRVRDSDMLPLYQLVADPSAGQNT